LTGNGGKKYGKKCRRDGEKMDRFGELIKSRQERGGEKKNEGRRMCKNPSGSE
jgi:hypothetical protein